MKRLAVVAFVMSTVVAAQVRPVATGGDPMQQSVQYADGQTVVLEAAIGYQLTVQLGDNEKIERAVTGHASRWQVLAPQGASQFYVQPMPQSLTTNLSLVTNQHRYSFLLVPAETMDSSKPLTVRFRYPEVSREAEVPIAKASGEPAGEYKLSGDATLRPSLIWDDGQKTYLDWPQSLEMPAVFAIGPDGHEQLVNGYMRGERYVIDAVYSRLLFRLDRQSARADRKAVAP